MRVTELHCRVCQVIASCSQTDGLTDFKTIPLSSIAGGTTSTDIDESHHGTGSYLNFGGISSLLGAVEFLLIAQGGVTQGAYRPATSWTAWT